MFEHDHTTSFHTAQSLRSTEGDPVYVRGHRSPRESSTLDLFLLMPALALALCFNVELVHHGHRVDCKECKQSFEGQAGVSQQDIVSDAVCQRLRRRSGGQMVDLSSENSLALDNLAPSTHALGLDAARGAVRRRWA